MKELIERIEGAEGPSYALDCEIWDAIYPGERQARFDKLTAKGQPYHLRLGPADMDGYVKPLRAYTASLDAAMTLVPEGWNWGVWMRHDWRKQNAQVWHREIEASTNHGDAATPALALVAAALKARTAAKDR